MNTSAQGLSAIAGLLFVPLASAMEVIVTTNDASCGLSNGWASAYVDSSDGIGGSLPYAYFWDPAPLAGQGTEEVSGLAPGEYSVTVTDAFGIAASATFTINALPELLVNAIAIDTIFSCFGSCLGQGSVWGGGPIGGTPPYTVSFDPPGPIGQVQNSWNYGYVSVEGLCEGQGYLVTVSDSQGCSSTIPVLNVVVVEPLQLLVSDISASCPNGSTGGLQLLFDQTVTLFSIDTITIVSENATLHELEGLEAGTYTFLAQGTSSTCNDTTYFTFIVPSSMDGCGTVSGSIYADLNGDCTQQIGEPGLPFRTVVFTPEPEDLVMTDANGNYSRDLLFGQHELHFSQPDFTPICPSALPVTFDLSTGDPTEVIDIAMEYELSGPDAYVHMIAWPPRIGDSTAVWITVTNDSPYAIGSALISLSYPSIFTFSSTSLTPDQITASSIDWQMPALAPFAQWQVSARFNVPLDTDLIGDPVSYSANLIQSVSDVDPSNDLYSINDLIVAAYDPNDKTAIATNSQSHSNYYFGVDEFIDYTIRFQNTGNAPAQHVQLIDTISDMHSLPSLQILGGSHEFEVQWQDDRVLQFDFPQIMLPDSATDPQGSQGFVSFRLRHLETLTFPGYVISNTADIFFDQNPPVRTNTTELLATEPTFVAEEEEQPSLHVYPNPANDDLFLNGGSLRGAQWEVIGIDGRRHLSGRIADAPMITVAGLSRGSYVLQIIPLDQHLHQARFVKE
ncbi:MAG: T9SS type A sorting domain-containing protein [Bacteroidota bacterium]|nr:T9SS type A sorting domain-containing protein [Bacteroidota bacterium]